MPEKSARMKAMPGRRTGGADPVDSVPPVPPTDPVPPTPPVPPTDPVGGSEDPAESGVVPGDIVGVEGEDGEPVAHVVNEDGSLSPVDETETETEQPESGKEDF